MIDPAEHDELVDKLEEYGIEFNLLPDFLEKGNSDIENFEWDEVKFEDSSRSLIPDERGIYAFTIHSSRPGLPKHGYIMYVGITGDNSSKTLRKRFKDYIQAEEAIIVKRPKVRKLLKKWAEVLYFQYVSITDESIDLHDIEQRLNDLFQSPSVTQDFSAEVRAARRAF
jgi:hypothetical protein